jgi:hypothetical protein
MEKQVCDLNNSWGIKESFIEQGHQVGLKDDRRYRGLTNFEKKTASIYPKGTGNHVTSFSQGNTDYSCFIFHPKLVGTNNR